MSKGQPNLSSLVLALFAQRPGQWMTSRMIAASLGDICSPGSVAMALRRLEAHGQAVRTGIGKGGATAWRAPT